MKTFKVLSALLEYPDVEMQAAADEMEGVLDAEDLLEAPHREAVANFIAGLREADLLDLQARYVALFDRSRALSLHLFEHVHGESRDRGQAMVDLRSLYEAHGLSINANELPDYLPLFLEFLSLLPISQACSHLAEAAHIVTALWEQTERHDSAYAGVLRAVAALAGSTPERKAVEAVKTAADVAARKEANPDGTWREAPVTFGSQCPTERPLGN